MPKGTTTAELQQLSKLMRIPYFRSIFILRTILLTGEVYRSTPKRKQYRKFR